MECGWTVEVGARIELVEGLGTLDSSVGRYEPFKCVLRELEAKNWLSPCSQGRIQESDHEKQRYKSWTY